MASKNHSQDPDESNSSTSSCLEGGREGATADQATATPASMDGDEKTSDVDSDSQDQSPPAAWRTDVTAVGAESS